MPKFFKPIDKTEADHRYSARERRMVLALVLAEAAVLAVLAAVVWGR